MLQGLVKYTVSPKPPLIERLDEVHDTNGAGREPVYA
jgi:hypothetical protein